ncbi:T-complex protein 11-domain-containing protein [Cubamyces menziesii]|nr:T-complex protein 11-domain-containing protein [Cubamyces menziesii]
MTPRRPADAPDGPSTSSWMLARSRQGMPAPWSQPSSSSASSSSSSARPPSALIAPQLERDGQPASKRLRIEIPTTPPGSPRRSRRALRPSPRATTGYQRRLRPGETRDTGIVSATEPGPSRGSLLRSSSLPGPSSYHKSRSVPASPIDPCSVSPHIPPHQPPINRETLKELDLDAILRNPQLRHDLLFDSGLQFRPTSSRRKRDLADQYWLAIVRELETGCTCTTIDTHGKLSELRCACDTFPTTPERAVIKYNAASTATVRAHSRIRPLLHELLEVLISIIQPPQPPSLRPPELLFPPPPPQHPQFQQNLTHVALLRAHLDPELIQQEISHGLFDPSGLFQVIGDIIRCHCAPMRDAAVDQMVALARSCAPGGAGTKLDAVRAIRMCFEIMELMKLDVANHQLQTLRPYLVRTAGEYEVRIFSDERHNARRAVHTTREWLAAAWKELNDGTSAHAQLFRSAARPTQVVMAVVKATVGLIFDPPPPGVPTASSSSSAQGPTASSTSSSSSSSSSSSRSSSSSSASHYAGYPETFYLDYGRFGTLSTDAADFTALYMLLMMYRQLVHAPASSRAASPRAKAAAVAPDALARLKKEIWEIGPAHPGLCFMQGRRPGSCSMGSSRSHGSSGSSSDKSASSSGAASQASSSSSGNSSSSSRHERAERDREAEMRKWRAEIEDVALQLAMHATSCGSTTNEDEGESEGAQRPLRVPDPQLVQFALGWTERNLKQGSAFSALCKRRLRERVEEAVLAIVLPQLFGGAQNPTPSTSSPSTATATSAGSEQKDAPATSSGLEPLGAEVKHISQRVAKLVEIHVSVYGELYAHPAFFERDILPGSLAASSSPSASAGANEMAQS